MINKGILSQFYLASSVLTHPEPILSRLVSADGEDKSKVLEDVIRAAYPSLFNDIDLTKATSNQFRQKFVEAGSSGDSIRKGIYFFLAAAKEANISVSPYIAEPTPKTGDSKPRKLVTRSPKSAVLVNSKASQKMEIETSALTWEQMLLAKFPSFDPAWPDEVKKEWFTAFNHMMKIGKPEIPDNEESEDAMEEE